MSKITPSFLKLDGWLYEFKYNSAVDYEKIFNNISNDTKNDLLIVSDYYYYYLSNEIKNKTSISSAIHSLKKINNMPVKIYLYIVTNYKEYHNDQECVKIGINVSLLIKDHVNKYEYDLLQHIFILNCDISNENCFKNYLYNILFYTHIVLKDFEYHQLLYYIHHKDDIDNLVNIKLSFIRLFGDKHNECSVCYENTIMKTVCNHYLCQKCFCSLIEKTCPLCRENLLSDDEYSYDIDIIM